jgi:hypothetical protein
MRCNEPRPCALAASLPQDDFEWARSDRWEHLGPQDSAKGWGSSRQARCTPKRSTREPDEGPESVSVPAPGDPMKKPLSGFVPGGGHPPQRP